MTKSSGKGSPVTQMLRGQTQNFITGRRTIKGTRCSPRYSHRRQRGGSEDEEGKEGKGGRQEAGTKGGSGETPHPVEAEADPPEVLRQLI